MSNATPLNNSPHTTAKGGDSTKQSMAKEISQKWNKFSEADVSAFKNKDDLVSHIVTKYAQDKTAVQKDVDTFLHGRTFG